MTLVELAKKLRILIEKAAQSLDDSDALQGVQLYPEWQSNTQYTGDYKVRYNNKLYRVLQQHTSQAGWQPDVAVSLFSEVLPGQDDTDIGEWVQPDSTNPYMKGDRVTFEGDVWESTINNNVWQPGIYGWTKV